MRSQLVRTRMTDLFGIPHPILCGGLIWLADAGYVAAAVNAGAMGFMTALSFPDDPERFRAEVRRCKALTSGKPFGVCLAFSSRPGVNERLKPYVRIVLEEKVKFIETSGASPQGYVELLKEGGCTIIHKAPAVRHAISAEKLGVDAVTVVGGEAGGHPGPYMVPTMVQAALAAESIKKPLAIGGGMGTGRHLAAILTLGADAMLMGSRMLAAEEIWAHPSYKERIVAAGELDHRVVMKVFRDNHRVLDNEDARAVEALELRGDSDFESYRQLVSGQRTREAYASGDTRFGMIDYGPAGVFVRKVESVESIIDGIIDEAAQVLERAAEMRIRA